MPLIKRDDYTVILTKDGYKRIKVVKTEYDKNKGMLVIKKIKGV